MTNHVVMPVRGCLELTQVAVASVLGQDIPVWLNIINNDSNPETTAWLLELEATEASVTVENNCPPRCVAASWNQALVRLFWHGAPWTLVVNNDIELQPHTYRVLIEQHLPVVSGISVQTSDEIRVHAPGAPSPHPDFSCFLIRREVFLAVGLFDEIFQPAYKEDQDYHRRCTLAGFGCYSVNVPFLHANKGSATIKADKKVQTENAARAELRTAYYKGKWGEDWPKEWQQTPFGG